VTALNDLTDVTIAAPQNGQRLVYENGEWINKAVSGAIPWTRDPSWLALPTVGDTEQKFVGLIAVYPESNFTAFTAAGNYAVDWGDGSALDTYSSGATALKQYNYSAAALVGTDAPVTLTDAGDLVTRTAHGYSNGNTVTLWNVTGSTGPVSGQVYYVINATLNTFQIATTPGGSPVAITTDGTATLLPYRQAIVTVTPQAGQSLTALNLNIRHTAAGLQAYETGWLDIELGSPNFTTTGLVIRTGTETVRMRMVERIRIANPGGNTTCVNMFRDCFSLQSVPLFNTAAVTNMNNMFLNCSSLQSVPLFNTAAVTNMSSMFQGCFSVQSVPLFNTAAVTNMTSMFLNCSSLQSVPLFNTAAVTNMTSMFLNCFSLQSVPLFNTAAVTNMTSMFFSCSSLQSVPLFNTAAVTNMNSMFLNCFSVQSVPLFNTAAVTAMNIMFQNCSSLQSVPLFNTAAVTNMTSMFQGCVSLQSVPALNVSAVSSAGNFTDMFLNCNSVARNQAQQFNFTFSVANNKLSGAALDEIYTNLPTVVGQTITVTGNFGTATHDPTIATGKGWTVTV
jgi:surface protein